MLAFLRSWEAWLTLALVFAAQFPVVASLESANWVGEMPSLLMASLAGLLAGWFLASIPRRALPLHVIGVAIGLVAVVGLVMHTMRLADPLLGTGVRARWSELWLRLWDWGEAAVGGGISSDPLPFVLLLVTLVWVVAYVSAWAVARWHNVWAALVPGGFVLLTNISYLPGQPSLAFVIFLFAAVLVVARMHYLKVLGAWRRTGVARPEFISLEVLFAGVWVGLILVAFAWAVPTANEWGPVADRWVQALEPVNDRLDRLGRLFIGVGSKKDLPTHAFGEVFPLQGELSLDDDILLEVTTADIGNLRGAAYDEYTGRGWQVSGVEREPVLGTSEQAAEFGTAESRALLRRPVTAEITVVGELPDRRLLSVGDPVAADVGAELLTGVSRSDAVALLPSDRVAVGDTYTTVGTVSAATTDTLLASGWNFPPEILERYTQLPADLPPEVRELALAVAGDAQRPLEVAKRVEQYLRENYAFALDVADPPPRQDVVSYFLFDARSGYFDYHASAMAVLLRSIGIPARVSTGFALDAADLDPETKTFVVSERRAWSWPEVYFAGLGWVEFNPTPSRGTVARPDDDSDLLLLAQSQDPEIDIDALSELLFEPEDEEGAIDAQSPTSAGDEGGIGTIIAQALTAIVIASAVVLALALFIRGAWGYQFRGLSSPVSRWARIQRLMGWSGMRTPLNRTPLELAHDRGRAIGATEELEQLARSFTQARYGSATR
jgi:transglutaminase-like putative cysteine protease